MGTGAITEYIDVAQLALYAFWLFFFALVVYLHREAKREGYPLVDSHNPEYRGGTLWGMPQPKTYILPNGQGTRTYPAAEDPQYDLAAEQLVDAPGFPLEPTGNPLKDGVGPAAWAIRPEKPDLTWDEGIPRIVPMRTVKDWSVESRDPDPRGRPIFGLDGEEGGTVTDLWIDLSEPTVRYLEIDAGGKRVMIPMTMVRVKKNGDVVAKSVCGKHFADAPTTANPDFVTLQEEDKIGAYYAGGYLYAFEGREEPYL
ncbi:MAG: photosynthetic reaction center subunit H [Halieaceae bacterium]|jgi:photosynthetic reaction center H subunit|nr:photosynthetic reaction center subunit H [Halieaceae bacterium]